MPNSPFVLFSPEDSIR